MSHSIYWRRFLQFSADKETKIASKSHMYFVLQNPSSLLKLVSYISNDATSTDHQQHSFTASYLINSCGLSPQSALSASKKIQLKSTKNPDSVLELFRNLGFTETQITKVVSKCPCVLLSKAEKTLLPKINVFIRYGFSGPELGRVISSFPSLFRESFNNKIIPAFDFLRSVVHTDENIAACVRHSVAYLYNFPEKITACVSILRNYGVPDSKIVRLFMMTWHPKALFLNVERFSEIAAYVKEMGFDPLSTNFVLAVRVMAGAKKSSWDKKLEVYRSLGWSEDEFRSAFKVQPKCMTISEEKIKKVADFLLSVMGWKPSVLSKCPNLLRYSLEKRIAPRCSVLRLLIAKGLIKDDLNLIWFLNDRETTFATRILIKYQDTVPEITGVYRGKVGLGSIASGSVDETQTV